MMNREMVQICLITLCLIGYHVGMAQNDYVVTIKRDTLEGKVKYYGGSSVKYSGGSPGQQVEVTPLEGKKRTLNVNQVLSFKIKDDIYHTIQWEDQYVFMKLLKPGYLSLYAYQMENQLTWDGRYLTKINGILLDVPNLGFKKKVGNFLAECLEVMGKVHSGELSKSNLEKIVDEYNACMGTKVSPPALVDLGKINSWNTLEVAVNALTEFEQKSTALEMIHEIQSKIKRNEKVPAFLTSGLKETLKDQPGIKETLEKALEVLD